MSGRGLAGGRVLIRTVVFLLIVLTIVGFVFGEHTMGIDDPGQFGDGDDLPHGIWRDHGPWPVVALIALAVAQMVGSKRSRRYGLLVAVATAALVLGLIAALWTRHPGGYELASDGSPLLALALMVPFVVAQLVVEALAADPAPPVPGAIVRRSGP